MVLEDVAKHEGNDAPTNMSGGRPDGDKWRHQDHASQWVLCCQKNRRAAPQRSTKDNHRWVAHPQVVHQISEDRQRHFEDGLCGMQIKDKDSETETRITRTPSKFTGVSGGVAGEECFGHLPPCSIPKMLHAVVNMPSWKLPIFKRKLLYIRAGFSGHPSISSTFEKYLKPRCFGNRRWTIEQHILPDLFCRLNALQKAISWIFNGNHIDLPRLQTWQNLVVVWFHFATPK